MEEKISTQMSEDLHVTQEKQDQLIELYLLGDLARQEREQIEMRYFADPEFLARLDAVEAELLEDYALGALGAAKAEKVEQHLLNSPYQLEKLRFAETMVNGLGEARATQPVASIVAQQPQHWLATLPAFLRGLLRPSVAIPVLATAIVLVLGLLFEVSRRRELENLRQEQAELKGQLQDQQATIAQQQKQLEQNPASQQPAPEEQKDKLVKVPPPPTSRLATFLLLSPVSRSSGKPQELKIPADEKIRLQLNYNDKQYVSYQATLESADGDVLLPPQNGLKLARAKKRTVINYVIPTKNLFAGKTYIVRLKGKAASQSVEIGLYDFIAIKR